MGAHVFIVTKDTFPVVRDKGIAAIVSADPSKPLFEKTKADLLSDIACVRKRDRIFFYVMKVGFYGIYEAITNPFIDESEFQGVGEDTNKFICGSKENIHYKEGDFIFPYRIQIKPLFYLPNFIPEMRAFGEPTSPTKLRSIFYKKTLGRGKSITHLSPEEEKELSEFLFKANDGVKELSTFKPYKPMQKVPITFDLKPTDNGCVKYEKILEGWIIQNIDVPGAIPESILGPMDDIEWFANYVPVTIAGGNIDIMIYHKKKLDNEDIRYKISIIELKKGIIKNTTSEPNIIQIEEYVKWAAKNITKGDMEMVQPILIGKKIDKSAKDRASTYSLSLRKPIFAEYTIEEKKIKLKKIEY